MVPGSNEFNIAKKIPQLATILNKFYPSAILQSLLLNPFFGTDVPVGLYTPAFHIKCYNTVKC
jgi:hypothetical protein